MPGYKEIVDFNEFIGYAVNMKTGEKLATTRFRDDYYATWIRYNNLTFGFVTLGDLPHLADNFPLSWPIHRCFQLLDGPK
jgi:hypothetical protein